LPHRSSKTIALRQTDTEPYFKSRGKILFGRSGRSYREIDVETADLETTVNNLLAGEYSNPVRVIAFNTAEQWSQNVSEDLANEIRRRCDLQATDVPSTIQEFVECHEGHARQLTLRLV
jgi:hypothetical protein